MATVLRLDSSIRQQHSTSRALTTEFISAWKARHPGDRVVERDLVSTPMPHLTEQEIGAALSDELVQELLAADVLVIGAPMYNLSISSSLKAWIDHVARAGITFKYTEKGPVGLLAGKKAYVFTARGGVYSRGPGKSMDFHETYLRGVLGFIGISDTTFVHTEGLAMGEATAREAIAKSRASIPELIAA